MDLTLFEFPRSSPTAAAFRHSVGLHEAVRDTLEKYRGTILAGGPKRYLGFRFPKLNSDLFDDPCLAGTTGGGTAVCDLRLGRDGKDCATFDATVVAGSKPGTLEVQSVTLNGKVRDIWDFGRLYPAPGALPGADVLGYLQPPYTPQIRIGETIATEVDITGGPLDRAGQPVYLFETATVPSSPPKVTSIVSAASYASQGTSLGDILVLVGENLGPTNLMAAMPDQFGRFPFNLGGTRSLC